ncbi:MAG TPA: hypothetical protein VGW78_01015 [Candidatus Babeliales bacterium]|jgi:hypothetical protein|nr:hypothetical protein [Candidatus Babeliales bacterium]
MHHTTKKYFSALSIGLLLSQPLSAMHYFDRKLFVGCCMGALGTLSVLFIKKHFFTGKPAMPKSNQNRIILLKAGREDGFFIDEQTNTAYPYSANQVLKVTPYTPPGETVSWKVPLPKNGQFVCFDQVTGSQTYFFEGRDLS